jgi:hypothetical protein
LDELRAVRIICDAMEQGGARNGIEMNESNNTNIPI